MARHRSIVKLLLVASVIALPASSASAETPYLLGDLVPGPGFNGHSVPHGWIEAGAVTFFIASVIGQGKEFFATDGTTEGTLLLADSGDSSPSPVPFGVLDGRLLWWTSSPQLRGSRGTLWSSDGTPERTEQLLPAGISIPNHPTLAGVAFAGELMYFVGCQVESCSIWSTDGTPAGTRPVHPISSAIGAQELVAAADRIFFTIRGELWVLDSATGAATLLLESDRESRPPTKLLDRGSQLFFVFEPEGRHQQIWISDGTPAGTRELTSFSGGRVLGVKKGPGALVYFVLSDSQDGTEVWRTDGSWAGTSAVTSFGNRHALDHGTVDELLTLGERVFFPARTSPGSAGRTIWVSDGTPESSRTLVACEGDCPEVAGPLAAAGERVVVPLRFADRIELWSSDGTSAGTGPLAELCRRSCAARTVTMSQLGSEVGAVVDGVAWITDGTPEGTRPINDPEVVQAVEPGHIGRAGACWLFAGKDERGVEPWCSEGEPGSARILADLEVRSGGSWPKDFHVVGSRAVFEAHDESGYRQVWSSDGTPGFVQRLTSTPGHFFSSIRHLVGAGDFVLFREPTGDPTGDPFLWRTDGTQTGTWPVGELTLVGPQIALDGRVYAGGLQGEQAGIWEIDGTPNGPRLVIPLPWTDLLSFGLATAGGAFYYQGVEDDGLWRSDGTEEGTWQVTPPAAEGRARLSAGLAMLDGLVYFILFSPEGGDQIWSTDGSPGSAQLVGTLPVVSSPLHVHQGAIYFSSLEGVVRRSIVRWTPATGPTPLVTAEGFSRSVSFTSAGDRLFFVLNDGVHGTELWRTDGTPAGTQMVSDLFAGGSADPTELTAVGDRLFFVAKSNRYGRELWEVDSSGEVRLVSDLAPGPLSSDPQHLTVAGNTLFFSADDGETGQEPWALPLDHLGPPAPPPGSFLSSPEVPGFRFKVRISSQAGTSLTGRQEPVCIPETLCVSGAVPGRSEVFLRVVGPRPNGFFWPTVVKFTTSRVEVWVQQTSSGQMRYYDLAGAVPGVDILPGLFDRQGFEQTAATASAPAKRGVRRARPAAAGSGEWLTSPALPGFRFRVEITDQQGQPSPARVESGCIEETVCFSGAVPGRSELFLRVVGPRPNGYLWPTLVRFSTSTLDVWITQTATGQERHYRLEGASPGSTDLSGLFDRSGFLP